MLRNRFRRWGREYLRKWDRTSIDGLDLNFIFKRQAKGFYESVAHKEFDEAMDKMVFKLHRSR